MSKVIELSLPYPPSINNYYGQRGKNVYVKAAGLAFRQDVRDIVERKMVCEGLIPITGPCVFTMKMYPPDKRNRDMDNVKKALWDALTKSGVWADDSDVVEAHEFKDLDRTPDGEGWVEVTITEHTRRDWESFWTLFISKWRECAS